MIPFVSIHTPLFAEFANAIIETGRIVSMQIPTLAFIACLSRTHRTTTMNFIFTILMKIVIIWMRISIIVNFSSNTTLTKSFPHTYISIIGL